MSIFGFVQETRKKKQLSHPVRRKTDLVVSPLDEEPDDPIDLSRMLEMSFESSLMKDHPFRTVSAYPSLYTVRQGDTLHSIAYCCYNDEGEFPKILEANGSWLARNNIYVGQILHVPLTERQQVTEDRRMVSGSEVS